MINERNIIGSGKSRIRIVSLDEVLMTPEQIREEERAEEERRKNQPKKPGKPTVPPRIPTVKPKVIIPGDYEIYDGRNVDKAQEILNAGKIIAPFFYIADKRINAKSKKDITTWVDQYYDTSDIILYNDKDNAEDIKIVLAYDAKYNLTPAGETCLKLIHPSQTLVNGGIDISGEYADIKGDDVISTTRNELAESLETGLSKAKAKDSKLWKMLLRHQDEVASEFAVPGLHKEYIDWVYSAYGSRFAKGQNIDDLELMGVYLASPQNVPQLRAWCVVRLEFGAVADGGVSLDVGDGRFAGISAGGAAQKS